MGPFNWIKGKGKAPKIFQNWSLDTITVLSVQCNCLMLSETKLLGEYDMVLRQKLRENFSGRPSRSHQMSSYDEQYVYYRSSNGENSHSRFRETITAWFFCQEAEMSNSRLNATSRENIIDCEYISRSWSDRRRFGQYHRKIVKPIHSNSFPFEWHFPLGNL